MSLRPLCYGLGAYSRGLVLEIRGFRVIRVIRVIRVSGFLPPCLRRDFLDLDVAGLGCQESI